MKTKDIFRKFKGEVLALFPAHAGTVNQPENCTCYAHVGQHGSANFNFVVASSRLATRPEYKPLAKELRRIGYQLDIRTRATRADFEARVAQLKH